MTKTIFNYSNNGDIMFDCINHAEDHDACTIMSTLCNVLVEASYRAGSEPTVYNKGHVRIDLYHADYPIAEVFRTVEAVMRHAEEQDPDHIRIY